MKLWPAIIQNEITGQVLMLGYMNQESLDMTLKSKVITFFSRSRNQIWKKGETSGNYLNLVSWSWDCDGDSLLFLVQPEGPTCHLKTRSCFTHTAFDNTGLFENLMERITDSLNSNRPTKTKEFYNLGQMNWIRKLQEEACEIALASSFETPGRVVSEAADLLYRLGILLKGNSIEISEIKKELELRQR
jgi:phosphoribosyl-ATP pyrophosphohydrolase/phosphoribosyl-AMP cyclohydrolase